VYGCIEQKNAERLNVLIDFFSTATRSNFPVFPLRPLQSGSHELLRSPLINLMIAKTVCLYDRCF